MKITAKQCMVLNNLHRIVMRPVRGRPAPFIDGENCRTQINSLAVKRLIERDRSGRLAKIGEPDGILDGRWTRIKAS